MNDKNTQQPAPQKLSKAELTTELQNIWQPNTARQIWLSVLDQLWREHLQNLKFTRDRVSLSHIAQQDPLIVYKKEAYDMFHRFLRVCDTAVIENIFHALRQRFVRKINDIDTISTKPTPKTTKKAGRNENCPCESGKKYKKCCGK